MLIPKILHCCWFGRGEQNDIILKCRDSWSRLMPDYTIKEWNETNTPLDNAYCRAAMEKGLWSKVSNFVRLWALHQEGGIYVDTDMEVIKSFELFRTHECFLGFQHIEEIPGWVNNAILGSVAGHPFLHRCMTMTREIHQRSGVFELSPRVITRVLKEMGLRAYGRQTVGGVTIFPVEYFYPYSWLEKFHPACITNETVAIHYWNHSWSGT